MREGLTGRVAFITGGAMGFGRAFGRALNAAGAHVAIADINHAAANNTASELNRPDRRAIGVECDVSDRQSVQQAVDRVVAELGGVDILINNAAHHMKKYTQNFASLTSEEVKGLFGVNVIGIVNCSLACRRSMAERGRGVVLNIASAAAFTSRTPYGVSKVAVRGLTIALATELSADGIRVNAVAPTLTETESSLEEYSDEEFETFVATQQLIKRRATMSDVCNAMLFLCSDEAAMITGETVRVTGGTALSV
ncbi:MAG: SDR family NAD(P)-dependent oxidoreductase [Acidimicrobiales bacterium]